MTKYILHCRAESGNCYKAALMLNLTSLDWVPRLVPFFTDESRPAFQSEVNEQGEIPVLEYGKVRLTQSGVILTSLAGSTGLFGGRNEEENLEILRWILYDNHKFTSYYATLRFLIGFRKTGETAITEFLRAQALTAFGVVENHLQTRLFLLGDRPTIADISTAGYLYFDEETGIDLSSFPCITAWKKRISLLPGWAHPYELMPRGSDLGRGWVSR